MNDDVILHGEQLLHALNQKDCERAREDGVGPVDADRS
jgi:hypothetical protein